MKKILIDVDNDGSIIRIMVLKGTKVCIFDDIFVRELAEKVSLATDCIEPERNMFE